MREAQSLILATNGFEQSELMVPLPKLREAGASAPITAPQAPAIRKWNEKEWGESVKETPG